MTSGIKAYLKVLVAKLGKTPEGRRARQRPTVYGTMMLYSGCVWRRGVYGGRACGRGGGGEVAGEIRRSVATCQCVVGRKLRGDGSQRRGRQRRSLDLSGVSGVASGNASTWGGCLLGRGCGLRTTGMCVYDDETGIGQITRSVLQAVSYSCGL